METWVLVLISIVNFQPVGIASVPGYPSQEACIAAGRLFIDSEHVNSLTDNHRREADYHCLPGPKK
jgi:hypothetical protein